MRGAGTTAPLEMAAALSDSMRERPAKIILISNKSARQRRRRTR